MNIRNAISKISTGLASQLISSATTFTFGLYLLRNIEIVEYGLYSIAFAIMLLLGGLGHGLFLIQMVVLSPTKMEEDLRNFEESILFMTLMAALLIALPAALSASAIQSMLGLGLDHTLVPALVGLMSVSFLIKEFYIRHAFNNGRGERAISANIVLTTVLAVEIALLRLLNYDMNVEIAIALYSAALISASLASAHLSKIHLHWHPLSELKETFHELFKGGKWALATSIVHTLRSQAHTIIVASLMGPIGVAKINAARMFVTPATLAIPALSQVLLPALARIGHAKGPSGIVKLQGKLALALFSIAALYSTALMLCWDRLSSLVIAEQYGNLKQITALWCLLAACLAVRNSLEFSAQALRMFKDLARYNTVAAIVALISVSICATSFGIEGAVIGMIAAEITLIIGLNRLLRRSNLKPVASDAIGS